MRATSGVIADLQNVKEPDQLEVFPGRSSPTHVCSYRCNMRKPPAQRGEEAGY